MKLLRPRSDKKFGRLKIIFIRMSHIFHLISFDGIRSTVLAEGVSQFTLKKEGKENVMVYYDLFYNK